MSDQALTSLSFASRADPRRPVEQRAGPREVLEELLDGVRIEAPRQVTLSSASGRFSATAREHPRPAGDRPGPGGRRGADHYRTMTEEDVTLPPRSRRQRAAHRLHRAAGVPNITLQVTDMAGTIVGTSDRLPIRAAQVSNVIWLIIGTGAALLLARSASVSPGASARPGVLLVDDEGPDDTRHEAEATEQTPTPA